MNASHGTRARWALIGITVILACSCGDPFDRPARHPAVLPDLYFVQDLYGMWGDDSGEYAVPAAINDVGAIVGFYSTSPNGFECEAFLWSGGDVSEPGKIYADRVEFHGVSPSGEIAGCAVHANVRLPGRRASFEAQGDGLDHIRRLAAEHAAVADPDGPVLPGSVVPFVVVDGKRRDLDRGTNALGVALDIADRGLVVGRVQSAGEESVAAIWRDGELRELDGSGSHRFTEARAVNRFGEAAGTALDESGGEHAALWSDGDFDVLPDLGGGASGANDINVHGDVVGWSKTEKGDRHACLWRDGEAIDLGTLGGGEAEALAINGRGVVVGWSTNPQGEKCGFLHDGGTMRDLNQMILHGRGLSDWFVFCARDINDSGQIVAEARAPGEGPHKAVLLRPGLFEGRKIASAEIAALAKYGNSLEACAQVGDAGAVPIVAAFGADLEFKNRYGVPSPSGYPSPLQVALGSDHPNRSEVVRALLAAGARPTGDGEAERSLLESIVRHGDLASARYLLEAGAEPYEGMTEDAVRSGNRELVEWCAAQEGRVPPPAEAVSGAEAGDAPRSVPPDLRQAVLWKDVAGVKRFLAARDFRARDPEVEQALRSACRASTPEIVALLLRAGIDPQTRDNGGSALYYAKDSPEKARLIIEAGGMPRRRQLLDHLLFNCIGYDCHPEVLVMFLEQGVDVNHAYDPGHTLLGLAAWERRLDLVRVLLDRGADPNLIYNGGSMLVRIASENHWAQLLTPDWARSRLAIMTALLDGGARLDTRVEAVEVLRAAIRSEDPDRLAALLGREDFPEPLRREAATALLHYAVRRGEPEVVRALLAAGADTGHRDWAGRLPRELAAAWPDVRKLLE